MFTWDGFLVSARADQPTLLALDILIYLYNKSYLVKGSELSETFNLSLRSIRRIINQLRDLGYDIEAVAGNMGGYRLTRSSLILPIRLSAVEQNHWQIISDTIKSSDVSNKYGILKTLDIIGLQAQLEGNYATSIYVTQKLNDNVHNKVDKIQAVIHKAMKEKRRILMQYNSFEWREFRPQQFQIFNHVLYIKGYLNNERDSFRTLRLSRFKDATLSDKKYSFNEHFEYDNDKSAFSKSIFKRYDVEFKVTKDQHDILDYVYGDHQSIYEESDHYRLCFEMEGDQMIKQLAYQFNVNAELIKPEHLKIELDAELEFMLRRHL